MITTNEINPLAKVFFELFWIIVQVFLCPCQWPQVRLGFVKSKNRMLEIRPNCEYCDMDLPADSLDACICTYECTFCRNCVDTVLKNVCPNCGGGFTGRPIRPKTAYRNETSLEYQAASDKRINTPYSHSEIEKFIQSIKDIPPKQR